MDGQKPRPSQNPSLKAVLAADRRQICIWYETLGKPTTATEKRIFSCISKQYIEFGGTTDAIREEISKLRPSPPKEADSDFLIKKADRDFLKKAPRSLLVGENRLYINRVAELFRNLRSDCDAAFRDERMASAEDDGLSAVKFLAEAVLKAVQQERQELKAAKQPRRKAGPHEGTKAFMATWRVAYETEKIFQCAKPATLERWIADWDKVLEARQAARASGKRIPDDHKFRTIQIRRLRYMLAKRLADLKNKKAKVPAIEEVKEKLAEQFVQLGIFGKPRRGQDALAYIEQKIKRSKLSIKRSSQKKGTN